MSNVEERKLKLSLFALRVGVFIVFFMWTLDKFINPQHTAAVFKKYYLIDGLGVNIAYGLGFLQLLLVLGFLLGLKKRITYGGLFILHAISTLSTWKMLINPWGPRNLLFFAAIPMLAAIYALYNLRESDTFLTIKKER